jgi:hypothetical protein
MAPPPAFISGKNSKEPISNEEAANFVRNGLPDRPRASSEVLPVSLGQLQAIQYSVSLPKLRKPTPLRPVYDDFQTAYSSILSTARSRTASPTPTNLLEENYAIPMQVLNGRCQFPRALSPLVDLHEPAPAMLKIPNTHDRSLSGLDFDVSIRDFSSPHPPKLNLCGDSPPTESIPLFSNLRKAWHGKTSPSLKEEKLHTSPSLKWPRNLLQRAMSQRQRAEAAKIHPLVTKVQNYDTATYDSDQNTYGHLALSNGQKTIPSANTSRKEVGQQFPDVSSDLVDDYYEFDAGIDGPQSAECSSMVKGLPAHLQIYPSDYLPDSTSFQDGSTVDNIVRQYGRNYRTHNLDKDSGEEQLEKEKEKCGNTASHKMNRPCGVDGGIFGLQLVDSDERVLRSVKNRPPTPVFWKKRQANPSGAAPEISLPQIPAGAKQKYINHSDSTQLASSVSYGDTRNLLEITQRTNKVLQGDGTFAAVSNSSQDFLAPPVPSRNPYRLYLSPSSTGADSSPQSANAQNTGRQQLINSSASGENLPKAGFREALERDVSRELRRISAFSRGSQESISFDRGHGGFQSSTDSSNLLNFMGSSDLGATGGHAQDTQARRGFYDQAAIPQTWKGFGNFNRVRIPIHAKGNSELSLRASQSRSGSTTSDAQEVVTDSGMDGDVNDWETVGESGIMSRNTTNPYTTMGGNIYQAGSSIVDISDDGSSSHVHFEHNDFASTDRIAQHPARIDYSFDYRQRTIKDGSVPVLLPAYKQLTVNGFPANSYRGPVPTVSSPPNAFNHQSAEELARRHANPFNSSPPEVMTADGTDFKNPRPVQGQGTRSIPFQESVKNQAGLAIEDPDSDFPAWMDDFGDPGPAIRGQCHIDDHGNNVYENMDSYVGDYSDDVHRLAGSSLADESNSSRESLCQYGNSVEVVPEPYVRPCGRNDFYPAPLNVQKVNRAPFIQGPPGSFYSGVRARPEPRGSKISPAVTSRGESGSNPYPTNQMRPLSLLTVHRPETPMTADGNREGDVRSSGEFIYRSPLAPIKSKSWRNLYSVTQLLSFREAANTSDGAVPNIQPDQVVQPVAMETIRPESSWKRLIGSPRLLPWARENSSVNSDLAGRKTKMSVFILLICCLFPPTLVLFSMGYMDNLMIWMTKGEISSFGKPQKKAARRLALSFFLLAIVGIVVTLLALKFTTPNSAI